MVRCAYDLKPSMHTSSTYIIILLLLLLLLLLVDTTKSASKRDDDFCEARFFPNGKVLLNCLGFCNGEKGLYETLLLQWLLSIRMSLENQYLRRESRQKSSSFFCVMMERPIMILSSNDGGVHSSARVGVFKRPE